MEERPPKDVQFEVKHVDEVIGAGDTQKLKKKVIKKRKPRAEAEFDESGEVKWKKDISSKAEGDLDVSIDLTIPTVSADRDKDTLKAVDKKQAVPLEIDISRAKQRVVETSEFEEEQVDDISEYLKVVSLIMRCGN